LRIKRWIDRKVASKIGEEFSGALGHGAVGTFPDRPYLTWQVTYEISGETVIRNNPETFLEGCEKLYKQLVRFGQQRNRAHTPFVQFNDVKSKVDDILKAELLMSAMDGYPEGRSDLWKNAIINAELFPSEANEALHYDHEKWEQQKQNFHLLPSSALGKELDVYKFHQAATYHRYYVLKDLLPQHGIVVF